MTVEEAGFPHLTDSALYSVIKALNILDRKLLKNCVRFQVLTAASMKFRTVIILMHGEECCRILVTWYFNESVFLMILEKLNYSIE
jgi:hypothetical protein